MLRSDSPEMGSEKAMNSGEGMKAEKKGGESVVPIEEDHPSAQTTATYPYKRVVHPFLCRLNDKAAFTVTEPNALIAAGFASMGMGLFTLFRPTPLLLFFLASQLRSKEYRMVISKNLVLTTTLSWGAVLILVLLAMGFVLTFSVKIKKRWVLLLHPWGLMVLYLDVFVWLSMTLGLHLDILSRGPLTDSFFFHIHYPIVYFVIIYIDSLAFFLLYYVYATYFIAAELSVIERCY